jgi:hypothetical protein
VFKPLLCSTALNAMEKRSQNERFALIRVHMLKQML